MSHLHQPTLDYLQKFNPPGKKSFMAKIVKAFQEDMAVRLRSAQTELAAGDAPAMAKTLHSICGSCRNVGAKDLAGVLQALEMEVAKGQVCEAGKLAEVEATFRQVVAELQPYVT